MTRDSIDKMRFDRRLADRHGWWKEGELDKELDAIPDSAAKATTLGAVEDAAKGDSTGSEAAL